MLLGGFEPKSVPVYAESVEYGSDRYAARVAAFKVIHAPTPDVFIRSTPLGGTAWEIFDLSADPSEHSNIAGHEDTAPRDAVEAVVTRVYSRKATAVAPDEGAIPDELLEQLRALGYVR